VSKNKKDWKKVSSRRAKLVKRVNGDYEPIPTPLKTMLIVALLIAVIMIPTAFFYYSTPGLGIPNPTPPSPKPDPFTTLWNGQISPNLSTGSLSRIAGSSGNCSDNWVTCATGSQTVTGNLIVVIITQRTFGGNPVTSVTDTLSTSYTQLADFSNGGFSRFTVYTGGPTATGSDTITAHSGAPNNGFQGSVFAEQYTGWSGSFGNTANTQTTSTTGTSGTDTLALSTSSSSIVLESMFMDANAGSCGTFSGDTGQSLIGNLCNTTNANQADRTSDWDTTGKSGSNSYTVSWSGWTSSSKSFVHYLLEIQSFQVTTTCTINTAWSCVNAKIRGGDIFLNPNSTTPGVVLSTSAVDFSTGASKSLAFAEMGLPTFLNDSNTLHNFVGEEYAWYLTLNATLPTQAGYTPLNDGSVTLLVMGFVSAASTYHYYVYMQRQLGATMNLGTDDPLSQCQQSSTLYLCANTGSSSPPQQLMSLVANFTGGANGGSCNANGQGPSCSYLCYSAASQPATCSLGGKGNSQINISAAQALNYTQPWMNLQTSYHVGFWMHNVTGGYSFRYYTSGQTGGIGTSANVFSIYIPTLPTAGPQDTGGFFGWLGRTVGGAVNTVINTIQNAGTFIQNTALGPIGSVLQGMVSWMISQIVNFLNWTGSGFGFPNLGTSLLTLFSDLITIITQVLLNFVSWVTSTGAFILNVLTFAINIFANSIIFGLLAFVVGPALTLLNIILLMITLFFAFATPASYLLMMDWVWGALMVYVIGVSGFLWWTDLNVQIFTFVFKMIWKFTELIWRGIVIIKSFIPTEGGTPADLKDPTPGGGPKGGSGSGGKPDVKKEEIKKEGGKSGGFKMPSRGYGQGAKDGDPLAVLLLAFMIMVLLYWLIQAALSPRANVNVVGCIAWSTNCHVQNGVTVGTINTTVFFAYLFDQGHGVRIIFTLLVPLVVIMFAYWFMKNVVGEDKARGNDFLNIGGTVSRTQRTGERTATSRRETMNRYRKNRGEE